MQHFRLCNALLLAATCVIIASVVSMESTFTCEKGHLHRLSCDYGVISVQAALYGRANSHTCSLGRPASQLSNTNCAVKGAEDTIKTRCDGMKDCELNMETFRTPDPCYGTYKYLETNYTCLPAIHVVACELSNARLYCDEGQVIHVYNAHYGRYDRSTCSLDKSFREIRNSSCHSSSTKVADSCNGKNSCEVEASNSVFGNPCKGTYKYLQVAYICEYPVVAAEENYYYSDLK